VSVWFITGALLLIINTWLLVFVPGGEAWNLLGMSGGVAAMFFEMGD
jgi:hypothetical protein